MGEGERQPIVAAILTCVCGRGDSLNLLTTNVMCFFFSLLFNNGKRFHSHSFGQFLQCFNLREFIESNTRYRQFYMQGQLYRYRYRYKCIIHLNLLLASHADLWLDLIHL